MQAASSQVLSLQLVSRAASRDAIERLQPMDALFRNRIAVGVLLVLAVGLGAVFFVLGLALLLGLFAAGAALGTGVIIYRTITGRRGALPPGAGAGRAELDPSLEVFPERRKLPDAD